MALWRNRYDNENSRYFKQISLNDKDQKFLQVFAAFILL